LTRKRDSSWLPPGAAYWLGLSIFSPTSRVLLVSSGMPARVVLALGWALRPPAPSLATQLVPL
jgi:hypothetical protein